VLLVRSQTTDHPSTMPWPLMPVPTCGLARNAEKPSNRAFAFWRVWSFGWMLCNCPTNEPAALLCDARAKKFVIRVYSSPFAAVLDEVLRAVANEKYNPPGEDVGGKITSMPP